jgi:hypothetical protein
MKSLYLSILVALTCVACSSGTSMPSGELAVASGDTVTMSGGPGVAIARDSLTTVDGNVLPCCTTDSAGVHVQVIGATLTFYEATTYAAMGPTPGGIMPVACVQGVPNGSFVARNNLLTLPDGVSYLLMPCTAGYLGVTLTEQVVAGDGSSTQRQVTLLSARYGWQRDLLSLTEVGGTSGATASMSADTIAIVTSGHRYSFVALPRP